MFGRVKLEAGSITHIPAAARETRGTGRGGEGKYWSDVNEQKGKGKEKGKLEEDGGEKIKDNNR